MEQKQPPKAPDLGGAGIGNFVFGLFEKGCRFRSFWEISYFGLFDKCFKFNLHLLTFANFTNMGDYHVFRSVWEQSENRRQSGVAPFFGG